MRVVTKIGSSSLTDEAGRIAAGAISKVAAEVAGQRSAGHEVVVVSSGAISAGLPALGFDGGRPADLPTLQAIAAVGQHRLMATWDRAFGEHGLVPGQVLLAPLDFVDRQQYLHARQTIERLLELGVVPVVNENDAVADDEIRFGDNDRLAALVAHLLRADLLVLLTDTPGLLTADPRLDAGASLIEEVLEIDATLESMATAGGSERGSGGMASKLAAAKMAAWSGVRVVIAAADRDDVLAGAVTERPGVGTVVRPRERRLSARKLWIAFAVSSTPAPAWRSSNGGARCSRRAWSRCEEVGRPGTRWRWPPPKAVCSPRAWRAIRPRWSGSGRASARPSFRTTWSPR